MVSLNLILPRPSELQQHKSCLVQTENENVAPVTKSGLNSPNLRILFGLFLLFVLVLLLGCLQYPSKPGSDTKVDTRNAITKEICDRAGGSWSGSSCGCGGIVGFKCPPSYVCTDYKPEGAADAMGVCKKVSE